jgi:septal ring factor EnvC (AmiA/AmiB activator)
MVIYADWFRGYGNLMIIDHGNDFCTIYAHAEEIFKSEGDSVDTDEVIGTVGDTGSLAGTKLYFEIRHKGKPIDPLAWLNGN